MSLTRRSFLASLLSGAAGLTLGAELDLERLLWVPKPIITVPALPPLVGGGGPNPFVTPDWIAKEALRLLARNLIFAQSGRGPWLHHVVGETVAIPLPRRVCREMAA